MGFADGIGSTKGLMDQAIAYRRRSLLNDDVDTRNDASAMQARALAARVQPPAPNTDGTHDHLGDAADAFPDGYTSSSMEDLA